MAASHVRTQYTPAANILPALTNRQPSAAGDASSIRNFARVDALQIRAFHTLIRSTDKKSNVSSLPRLFVA